MMWATRVLTLTFIAYDFLAFPLQRQLWNWLPVSEDTGNTGIFFPDDGFYLCSFTHILISLIVILLLFCMDNQRLNTWRPNDSFAPQKQGYVYMG